MLVNYCVFLFLTGFCISCLSVIITSAFRNNSLLRSDDQRGNQNSEATGLLTTVKLVTELTVSPEEGRLSAEVIKQSLLIVL